MDVMCPTCGEEAYYIELYSRWYCYGCEQYIEESEAYPPIGYDDRKLGPYSGNGPSTPVRGPPGPAGPGYAGTRGYDPVATGHGGGYGAISPAGGYPGAFRLPAIGYFAQRMGKVLLIVSIIGLVLFLVFPWISMDDPDQGSRHYNFQLKHIAGNDTIEKLEGSYWNPYEDRIWMSILGSAGGIILGGILVYSDRGIDLRNERAAIALVGVSSSVIVVLAALVLFSGTTFVGMTVMNEMNKSTDDDLDAVIYSPAGVVALIIGGIMARYGFNGLKESMARSRDFELRRMAVIEQERSYPGAQGPPGGGYDATHNYHHDPYQREGGY